MVYEICPRCDGRGEIKIDNQRVTCPRCGGTGAIDVDSALTAGSSASAGDAFSSPQPARNQEAGSSPASSRVFWPWLLAAVALLSVAALVWFLSANHQWEIIFNNSNSNANSNKNINMNGGTTTPTAQSMLVGTGTPNTLGNPSGHATPTTIGGVGNPNATPTPLATSISGVPTATPAPNPTPTSTPLMAQISVSPSAIDQSLCILGKQPMQVANIGGGTLNWSVKSSDVLIGVTPKSGVVDANKVQSITVTLNSLVLNGMLTFTGNGGTQIVAVKCT